jgi:hypothetical protein
VAPFEPVQPCPLASLAVVEVVVLDQAGAPVSDVKVAVKNRAGQAVNNKTNALGVARFPGLEKVTHQASLLSTDASYWTAGAAAALPAERAKSESLATWSALDAPSAEGETRVEWGECLYSIAARAGLPPDAVWKKGENHHLAEGRDEPVLQPGDTLSLPAVEVRWFGVEPGQRYEVKLQAKPTVFRADLRDDDEPRGGLECLVEVDGVAQTVTTTKDGVLEVPVPPTAQTVKVTVSTLESFEVDLGELLPVSTVGGVERRLFNLGYLLYQLDGEDEEADTVALRAAIRWFQDDYGLEPSGTLDDEGQDALRAAHGS